MGESPAIEAVGLRKSYAAGGTRTEVLKGVDLTVRTGECLFLLGPSGSGKTTLLSILGCVLSPDAGELTIHGRRMDGASRGEQARFRRQEIGFVFQRFHLFRGLRAWENVAVMLDLLGRRRSVARKRACELLERVGLKDQIEQPVDRMSMGQRQRVAVARALANDPPLILADEPTASLDAENGLKAMNLLKTVSRESRKTVIVVTHDSRILPLADRVLTMAGGRLEDEPHRPTGDQEQLSEACLS